MKHTKKVTMILLAMFLLAQLIGIFVSFMYLPASAAIKGGSGEINSTDYNLPYGFTPPEDVSPGSATTSIIIALVIAVSLVLVLMKLRAEVVLRVWFFIVIIVGIGLALNAFLFKVPYASLIAIIIALPLAFFKVFKRNIIVHNITELLVYPGIAAVFVPLLSVWSVVLLLVIISIYDMYAVWHAGFMQKMAKYQMEKVKVFPGFFVPYLGKKDRVLLKVRKKSKSKKPMKVSVAILGGGDIVFPMILSGVVLAYMGLAQALLIAIGATIALTYLFYVSEKGKFYPAMPFITVGCLIALGIALLI